MNTDDISHPAPSFADYLACRRIPATAWGDFVREKLRLRSFPEIASWADLRNVVENCREFDIATSDARAAWSAYQSMLRDLKRKSASQCENRPSEGTGAQLLPGE